MSKPIRVCHLKVLDSFNVQFTFTDDTTKIIDLDRYLVHSPYYDALRSDLALFRTASVEGGTIVWANEADIDPDVLYLGLSPNASEVEWRTAKMRVRQSDV